MVGTLCVLLRSEVPVTPHTISYRLPLQLLVVYRLPLQLMVAYRLQTTSAVTGCLQTTSAATACLQTPLSDPTTVTNGLDN